MVRSGLAAVCIIALLAGCGGGGGGGAGVPGAAKIQTVPKSVATLSLKVPFAGRHTRGTSRRPLYVAPTTESFTLTINSAPVATVTQNVSSCNLTTARSEVGGLNTENGITTSPQDGSVWISSSDASPTNNFEAIQRDQSIFFGANSYAPQANAIGADLNGDVFSGAGTTFNVLGINNIHGSALQDYGITAGSIWPFSGQAAQGNDGKTYYVERDNHDYPVNYLGQIVSLAYTTDVPITGAPTNLIASTDGMLWYSDPANGKIGQYDAKGSANAEFSAPAGLTVLPIMTPSLFNTDVFALASDGGGVLSIVDFTEAGGATIYQTLPPSYTAANVTGLVQGADFALWLSQNGGTSGNVVRLAVGSAPFSFSPQSPTAHIGGITTGGDGSIYYLENDAAKVGELALSNTCTASLPVPLGTFAMSVTTYDKPNATGSILGTLTGNVTIATNSANNINLTLNGVLKRIQLVPQFATVASGCPLLPDAITVQGLDADGNIIVPPATFVDSNNNPISVTLSSSNGNTMTPASVSQTGVSSVTYPVAYYTDTITATASGGGVPNATTQVHVTCGG